VNFDLTEDQVLLKNVAEKFVADRYDLERRGAYQAHPAGFSPENWELMGELGLIAMAFCAESGGLASSAADLAIVHEALGRGLVVEPLIESTLVSGGLFDQVANAALQPDWIDSLVSGTRRIALAHRESHNRRDHRFVKTQAVEDDAGWRITGEKILVPAGTEADAFIVSARTQDGIVRLFFIESSAPGLWTNQYHLIDGSSALSVSFRDLSVPRHQLLGGGLDDIEDAEARAAIARCAEALGIMERIFADTLDYLRTRKQFGVPLSSFQALQHRMVSQYAAIEQCRALLHAAVIAESADRSERLGTIAGTRAFFAEASIALGHEMIQMHGGMGVTDELAIGHGHKRLVMLSRYPDDAESALDRYAEIEN
jgi:alkylation response protein AidB-like acyl-CoA dehydrogenase